MHLHALVWVVESEIKPMEIGSCVIYNKWNGGSAVSAQRCGVIANANAGTGGR